MKSRYSRLATTCCSNLAYSWGGWDVTELLCLRRAYALKLPSDLAGISVARCDAHRIGGNPVAAVGSACSLIRRTIKSLGLAEARSNSVLITAW